MLPISALCVLAPLLSTEVPQGVLELRGADVKRFFKYENEVNPQIHLNKCSFLIIYIIADVKMDVYLDFLLLPHRHFLLLFYLAQNTEQFCAVRPFEGPQTKEPSSQQAQSRPPSAADTAIAICFNQSDFKTFFLTEQAEKRNTQGIKLRTL